MYKIAITGKANSGKNTVGKLLIKELYRGFPPSSSEYKFIAFADPIKKMARLAFPQIPRKWLYGPSKFRAQVIPNAFKDGTPLTVRQVLIDIGNDFGRKYQADIWINNLEDTFNKLAKKSKTVIVTDVRFRNEFDRLKKLGFFQIRLLRDSHLKIDDVSETNQDGIHDDEFDCVIHNNSTLPVLIDEVKKITTNMSILA
jgi:hypothetical protein